jgi:putative peptidoglycan lipid II flippase
MRLTAGLGMLAASNVLVMVGTHWYVVTGLGATRETDALFAGMILPQILLTIFSGSLSSVLVPLFATLDSDTAERQASGSFLWVCGGFAAVSAVLAATAPVWVRGLVPGFSPSAQALTVLLTQIQLISVVLSAGAAVLTAFAHASRRFIWAETAPLVGGLTGLVAVLILLPRYGVAAAAWAFVLRALVHLCCLVPVLRWRRPAPWRSPAQDEARRRILPLLFGGVLLQTRSARRSGLGITGRGRRALLACGRSAAVFGGGAGAHSGGSGPGGAHAGGVRVSRTVA